VVRVAVQMSGGEVFVTSAVEMLKRRCLQQLSSDVTLYDDSAPTVPVSQDAVDLIHRQLCIERCRPHGRCEYGLYTGWAKKARPQTHDHPQFCQILTDLQKNFTGRFHGKFVVNWLLRKLATPSKCCHTTL